MNQKKSVFKSSVNHLRLVDSPKRNPDVELEENIVKQDLSLKQTSERRRKTFLRWLSLILSEPCIIRWKSPHQFEHRHEFESHQSRHLHGPGRTL